MKKIYLIATLLLATVIGFTSCGDDKGGESNYNIVKDPAAAVAKTYAGIWTRTLADEVKTSSANVSLAGTDQPNVVSVTLDANSDVALDGITFNANIIQQNDTRFVITKPLGAKDFTTVSGFRAQVENGVLTINYIKSVKVGRKNNEYTFAFEGK